MQRGLWSIARDIAKNRIIAFGVALEALFVPPGILDEKHLDAFHVSKMMRENADYEEEFSAEGARKIVDAAVSFLSAAKSLLRKKNAPPSMHKKSS